MKFLTILEGRQLLLSSPLEMRRRGHVGERIIQELDPYQIIIQVFFPSAKLFITLCP